MVRKSTSNLLGRQAADNVVLLPTNPNQPLTHRISSMRAPYEIRIHHIHMTMFDVFHLVFSQANNRCISGIESMMNFISVRDTGCGACECLTEKDTSGVYTFSCNRITRVNVLRSLYKHSR